MAATSSSVGVEELGDDHVPLKAASNAKPSIIESVCDDAIHKGYIECIWLCYNKGGKYIARDIAISLEAGDIEAYSLRYRCGWWKRISLRSPTRLHIVNMHFLGLKSNKEIEVMVLPDNVASKVAEVDRYLEEHCPDGECDAGFHENGKLQACTFGSLCPNRKMYGPDDFPTFHCSQERYHEVRLYKRALVCREAMLDFYWNSRGKTDSLRFLKDSGLVTKYSDLKTTHFLDAAYRYGESTPALLLVDGWHKKKLLILIGFAGMIIILVTVFAAAIGRSLNTGLTAGSYTSGIVAVLIAVLTFFSATL